MSEINIPLLVEDCYVVVTLSAPDKSPWSEDDVRMALQSVTDDVEADLRRRAKVKK